MFGQMRKLVHMVSLGIDDLDGGSKDARTGVAEAGLCAPAPLSAFYFAFHAGNGCRPCLVSLSPERSVPQCQQR